MWRLGGLEELGFDKSLLSDSEVWGQWNDVLRFELKKLSGLEIYKISITHNLKDNNFNTYLYLRGGSS